MNDSQGLNNQNACHLCIAPPLSLYVPQRTLLLLCQPFALSLRYQRPAPFLPLIKCI
jgi:hypothetical protein